jgi:RNA polymerase sigma-70 factor (ECF subfamily)
MQETTDADLVRRSARGEREAFADLVYRYRRSLAALIRRLVADLDEAEDLLQETLVQAWLRIGDVRDSERVHAWLLQVARNRCRDHHKSPQRNQKPTDDRDLERHMNRYGRAESPASAADDVEEAVHSLSPVEREVVQLFYLRGLTIREICARTGSREGTVKCRLFTARHHLRSFFETDEEDHSR